MLLELPHDVRQCVVSSIKLVEGEVLPVSIATAGVLVYAAMQIGNYPREIPFPATRVKRTGTRVDFQPTKDATHFVWHAIVQ